MKNKAFYIVSRFVDGELEPATNPRLYDTYAQARAVAYKLAEEAQEHYVVLKAVFETRPAQVQGFYLDDE